MTINIDLMKLSDSDLAVLRTSLINMHNNLSDPSSITSEIIRALDSISEEREIRRYSFKD